MSFILDALRKSEHQRDKGLLPARFDAPATRAAASRLPLVLGVVGALLAVNVVVLLVVLLRPAAAPREAAARGPDAAPAPPLAATQFNNATAAGDRPAVPAVRPLETEVEEGTVAAALEPPPLRAGGARVRRAAADDSTRPAAFGRGAPAQARDGGATGVRSLNELPPQATAGLPRLNIDLHVYGPDAARRFVVLNGRRYREGDHLQEGPTLEQVTADGVVLNHRGLRFLLPRE